MDWPVSLVTAWNWLLLVIVVLGTGFWVWMLIEAATREQGGNKIAWIVILVFTHVLGALAYFFIRRPAHVRSIGR